MKITFQQIDEVIALSQDGKQTIRKTSDNPWNEFLFTVVVRNGEETESGCFYDMEDIKSDIRYGIDQFKKALAALEAEFPEPEKPTEIEKDALQAANSIMPFITIGISRGSENEVRDGIAKTIEKIALKHKLNGR